MKGDRPLAVQIRYGPAGRVVVDWHLRRRQPVAETPEPAPVDDQIVIVVTFDSRAAAEIEEHEALGHHADVVWPMPSSTHWAHCLHWHSTDQEWMGKEALKEVGLSGENCPHQQLQSAQAVDLCLGPEALQLQ